MVEIGLLQSSGETAEQLNSAEESPFVFRSACYLSIKISDDPITGSFFIRCDGRIFLYLSGMFELSPDRKMLHVDSYRDWNKLIVTKVLAPRYAISIPLLLNEWSDKFVEHWYHILPIECSDQKAILAGFVGRFYQYSQQNNLDILVQDRSRFGKVATCSLDEALICHDSSEYFHLSKVSKWFYEQDHPFPLWSFCPSPIRCH
jgi:hypothetical protein